MAIGKLGISLSVLFTRLSILFTRLDTRHLCQWGEGGGKGAVTKGEKGRKNKWIPGQTRIILEEIESQIMGGIYALAADFSN